MHAHTQPAPLQASAGSSRAPESPLPSPFGPQTTPAPAGASHSLVAGMGSRLQAEMAMLNELGEAEAADGARLAGTPLAGAPLAGAPAESAADGPTDEQLAAYYAALHAAPARPKASVSGDLVLASSNAPPPSRGVNTNAADPDGCGADGTETQLPLPPGMDGMLETDTGAAAPSSAGPGCGGGGGRSGSSDGRRVGKSPAAAFTEAGAGSSVGAGAGKRRHKASFDGRGDDEGGVRSARGGGGDDGDDDTASSLAAAPSSQGYTGGSWTPLPTGAQQQLQVLRAAATAGAGAGKRSAAAAAVDGDEAAADVDDDVGGGGGAGKRGLKRRRGGAASNDGSDGELPDPGAGADDGTDPTAAAAAPSAQAKVVSAGRGGVGAGAGAGGSSVAAPAPAPAAPAEEDAVEARVQRIIAAGNVPQQLQAAVASLEGLLALEPLPERLTSDSQVPAVRVAALEADNARAAAAAALQASPDVVTGLREALLTSLRFHAVVLLAVRRGVAEEVGPSSVELTNAVIDAAEVADAAIGRTGPFLDARDRLVVALKQLRRATEEGGNGGSDDKGDGGDGDQEDTDGWSLAKATEALDGASKAAITAVRKKASALWRGLHDSAAAEGDVLARLDSDLSAAWGALEQRLAAEAAAKATAATAGTGDE